ncbi:hypothetical protein BPOR_0205g00160 [Botrytis porri]|uniref:Uncharacterized protein n=1 Tax=Botrytis porri TaxID=87229 RepID=A0A4Z1KP44_9HELO|nr:hypothetical protein BPOR_0205g00160 [Botrytis porri]
MESKVALRWQLDATICSLDYLTLSNQVSIRSAVCRSFVKSPLRVREVISLHNLELKPPYDIVTSGTQVTT